jgi:hypothetical protein
VLARTRVDLDGNVALFLPSDKNEDSKTDLDPKIISLYKENVDIGLRCWKEMVDTLSKIGRETTNKTELQSSVDKLESPKLQNPTSYNVPIGDGQNIIGNIHED